MIFCSHTETEVWQLLRTSIHCALPKSTLTLTIHSLLSITTYPMQDHAGLEPIPAVFGQKGEGYTLDWSAVHHSADI